jgi:two-component sensor histidine kinase
MHTLLPEELTPYNLGGTSRAHINGPELVLEAKLAQTVAMVLHELTTNAVKYGALSVPSGRLLVEWSRDETQLAIHGLRQTVHPLSHPLAKASAHGWSAGSSMSSMASYSSIGIPKASLAR